MFSKKTQAIYTRLLILGLLSMCLYVFGFSDKMEAVQAGTAICFQDCIKYEEMCLDNCQGECATQSRDMTCNSCISSCFLESNSCQENSIYCPNGTVSYDPDCTVQFGTHCVVVGGVVFCNTEAGAHQGHFLTCERIGYENGCIVCPSGEICQNENTGNLPHCLDN